MAAEQLVISGAESLPLKSRSRKSATAKGRQAAHVMLSVSGPFHPVLCRPDRRRYA